MSSLSTSIKTEIDQVIAGNKEHGQFIEFFKRIEPTIKSLKSAGTLDKEDGTMYKLGSLLADNKLLLKDNAFLNKLK